MKTWSSQLVQLSGLLISSSLMILILVAMVGFTAAGSSACRIGILDTQRLASAAGLEGCSAEDLVATTSAGVIYLRDRFPSIAKAYAHYTGQHAGLFLLAEAVGRSWAKVDDLSTADVILVDDYCYRTAALARSHSQTVVPDRGEAAAAALLKNVYDLVLAHPVFRARNGTSFLFFWMHPSWSWEDPRHTATFHNLKCDRLLGADFAVTERAELSVCDSYSADRVTLVPYTSFQAGRGHVLLPHQRRVLLAFKGTCTPWAGIKSRTTVGKLMRGAVVKVLGDPQFDDLQLSCAVGSHSSSLKLLREAKFCLVIPGDTQSSRRLTEIILEGCIPVFLGPPWHSVPWHKTLDYTSFSLFIDVSVNSSLWLGGQKMMGSLSPTLHPQNAQQARYWLLDGEQAKLATVKMGLGSVVGFLRSMAQREAVMTRMHANLRKAAIYFRYTTKLHDPSAPTSAVDAIVADMCKARH